MMFCLSRHTYEFGDRVHTLADLRDVALPPEQTAPAMHLTLSAAVAGIAATGLGLHVWCADDDAAGDEIGHQIHSPCRPWAEIAVCPFPWWYPRPWDLIAIVRMLNAMREIDNENRTELITPLALGAMEAALGVHQSWWIHAVTSYAAESDEFRNAAPRIPDRAALAYLRGHRAELSKRMPKRDELPAYFDAATSELPAGE